MRLTCLTFFVSQMNNAIGGNAKVKSLLVVGGASVGGSASVGPTTTKNQHMLWTEGHLGLASLYFAAAVGYLRKTALRGDRRGVNMAARLPSRWALSLLAAALSLLPKCDLIRLHNHRI